MRKDHLSLSMRIHNAEGSQAAEYLHARHSYLHAKSFGREEWGEFWYTGEEASWAHSFGRMRGFDEVWYNNVCNYDPDGFRGYMSNNVTHPEIGWFDPRTIREVAVHTLATDIVEVADDGLTARASFLTPGLLFNALGRGENFFGLTLWERYGSDFIYDDGQWLYLHEQVCPDMGGPADVINPGRAAYEKLLPQSVGDPGGGGLGGGAPGGGAPGGGAPGGGAPGGGGHGSPASEPEPIIPGNRRKSAVQSAGGAKGEVHITDPGPLHYNYTPLIGVQDTVPWPLPYTTMDNNNTYTKSES